MMEDGKLEEWSRKTVGTADKFTGYAPKHKCMLRYLINFKHVPQTTECAMKTMPCMYEIRLCQEMDAFVL